MRPLPLLALSATSAWAQSGDHISLKLGWITVWIGEDKVAVRQDAQAAGLYYTSNGLKGDRARLEQVSITGEGTHEPHNYSLKFEDGKLVYADRDYLHSESEALPSVMDAFASLVQQGVTNCTIEHTPVASPDMKLNRISIDCGPRGVVLTYGPRLINGKSYTTSEIRERIGTLR